jgi:NAD+ synthase (glutamine-hydrolysing)
VGLWSFQNKKFALLICEDMWASSFHALDPARELKDHGPFDGLFNLSASPFDLYKKDKRIQRAQTLSHFLQAPFFYVNRVGGEDEILFDGQSFAVNGSDLLRLAPPFSETSLSLELPEIKPTVSSEEKMTENTWESLFAANFSPDKTLPRRLKVWSYDECQMVFEALKFGLQEYATKSGFKKFLIALSGGLDSALVLTLAKFSLKTGQELEAIYMPGLYSSPLSWELSYQLCQNLGVKLSSLPIKFLHSNIRMSFQNTFTEPFEGLTDENVQSRLRGLLLYTRSNQTGAMVINTSNKSELAVGYSTQYGDSVGAICLLGDLYKSEAYRLAEWINDHLGKIIPNEILTRPPTAELREGQTDQQSLPPYERLDSILEGLLSYRHDSQDLLAMGFEQEEIERVFKLYSDLSIKGGNFAQFLKSSLKVLASGIECLWPRTITIFWKAQRILYRAK